MPNATPFAVGIILAVSASLQLEVTLRGRGMGRGKQAWMCAGARGSSERALTAGRRYLHSEEQMRSPSSYCAAPMPAPCLSYCMGRLCPMPGHATACSFLRWFLPFLPLPPTAERPPGSLCKPLFDWEGFGPGCAAAGQASAGPVGQRGWGAEQAHWGGPWNHGGAGGTNRLIPVLEPEESLSSFSLCKRNMKACPFNLCKMRRSGDPLASCL